MQRTSLKILVTLGALLLTTGLASARDGQPPADGERRPPPRVAVEACLDLLADEVCGFEGRDGAWLEGTCFKPDDAPADAPLACRPDEPPARGARAPR